MSARTRSVIKRLLLMAMVCGGVIAATVFQSLATMGRQSDIAYAVRTGEPVLPPIDGSVFIRSYPVVLNGREGAFAHYRSQLPAGEVIKAYMERNGRNGNSAAPERPNSHAPALSALGAGCSVLSYATSEGDVIGVIAFDNPQSGGAEYFVGTMPAGAEPSGPATGDCPGRQPTGVPRPGRSTRTLCIENLGGLPSVLACYDAWGGPGEIADDFREDMARNGWSERADSSAVLTANYEGAALLSFTRGREQCVVAVDREPESGRIIVVVFWAERAWLPEGTAL